MYDPVDNEFMSTSRIRASRVFTISFPEPLARQVEEIAQEEHRNISELFREAFRSYRADRLESQLDALRQKRELNSLSHTAENVESLIAEARGKKATTVSK